MARTAAVVSFASLGLIVLPLLALAQPTGAPGIGFLSPASAASMAPRVEALRRGLRELSYRENQDLVIHFRWAEGKEERLADLAAELLRLKPKLVMVHGVNAAKAVQRASSSIPIVCFACGDVLGTRLVASLSRPGGNITGISVMQPEVSGKRLELLKDLVPGLNRVAVLLNSTNPVAVPELRETEQAARSLGLQIQTFGVADASELQSAFSAMARAHAQALIVLSDAMFFGRRQQISQLAAAHKLPAISWSGEFARAGSLIGYGPDVLAIAHRSAYYVDRILRGAKPAELPIEQPSQFELVVNLRTAKALRIAIPQVVLMRADRVVE